MSAADPRALVEELVETKAQVGFCCTITAEITLFFKSLLLLEATAFGKDCCFVRRSLCWRRHFLNLREIPPAFLCSLSLEGFMCNETQRLLLKLNPPAGIP